MRRRYRTAASFQKLLGCRLLARWDLSQPNGCALMRSQRFLDSRSGRGDNAGVRVLRSSPSDAHRSRVILSSARALDFTAWRFR
jgi:hypothetical protein